MEDWVTIRNLKKKNPSMGTRKIAKLTGLSRNTVRRAMASEACPRYHREQVVSPVIDPFTEYIRESYLVTRQKVSVIIANIRSKGFAGSTISIYRYIAQNLKRERDMGSQRAYEPYSTLPGEQMLYDRAEYWVSIGGKPVTAYVHLTELGFSRYKVFDATLSVKMSDVFEVMENAFASIGGLTQRIQVDNARIFVTDASMVNFQWNRQFLEFCGFYGIHPARSLPGHPWSKGKVERPFRYVEDHFITNTSFESFEDFYQKLKAFEHRLNDTIHTVTRKKPAELFADETRCLLELPRNAASGEYARYGGHRGEIRKVSKDCLNAFGSNRYTVPHFYAGQDVWVRVAKGVYVTIASNTGTTIAAHPLQSGKGHVTINRDHYKGHIHQRDRESFFVSAEKLRERFVAYERMDQFLGSLKSQRTVNVTYHLFMITRLFDDYPEADCRRCMEECLKYRCFTVAFIRGYLASRYMSVCVPPVSPGLCKARISSGVNVKRSLEEYRL
jgi:transposase